MKTKKVVTGESTDLRYDQLLSIKVKDGHIVQGSKDALRYLEDFRNKRQEYVIALYLDSMQRVIE